MIRPARTAAFSGANPEIPFAMTSALTNSVRFNDSCRSRSAAVDLPAPLGPARTTTVGVGLFSAISESPRTLLPLSDVVQHTTRLRESGYGRVPPSLPGLIQCIDI